MKDGTAEFSIKKIISSETVDAKLDAKQDSIEDTGWIEVTEIGSNFTVRSQYYIPVIRRIGKQVFFKGQFDNKKHTSNGTREGNIVCRIPQAFRSGYEVTVNQYYNSWIDSEGYLLWGTVYPGVDFVQIHISWVLN